jgi:DNA repair exonuclease SbcCD ATPase subunit
MSDVGKELVRRLSLSAEITAGNDALRAEVTRLRAEVERLRMTPAELAAVEEMIANYDAVADSNHERFRYSLEEKARRRAATLRAIAERHGRAAAPIV